MANIDHHFYEALGRDLHRQRMAKKIKLQRVSDLTGLPLKQFPAMKKAIRKLLRHGMNCAGQSASIRMKNGTVSHERFPREKHLGIPPLILRRLPPC
jgi:hypothetical protein